MIPKLKDMIEKSPAGMITYADYIQFALYDPEYGYYMREKVKIGKEGDFYTSSNVSSIYGKTFARWFAMLAENGMAASAVCEIGGGNGRFARSFLEEWKEVSNEPLTYYIVETSPYHRKLQKDLLSPEFEIIQLESLKELNYFEGMIFSNELFDALPVHLIEKEKGELFELMVSVVGDQLTERKVPLTNPEILAFLQESGLKLSNSQRIEIPLQMEKMIQGIAERLKKGVAVTVDYGYTTEDWGHPSRRNGSLRGYYKHQMENNVLNHTGEMDITSHIHFDWLINRGEKYSLQFVEKLRQDEFLLKSGILKELEENYDPNPFSETSKRNRAIRSLIMPSGISGSFHILIQQKGQDYTIDDYFSNNKKTPE